MRGRFRLQWLGLFVLIVSLLLPLAPGGALAQDDTGDPPPIADADGDQADSDGNVTLTGVTISDPLGGLTPLSCDQPAPVSLAAGERLTCTATYTIGLANEQRRQVANTAIASATFGGETISALPTAATLTVDRPTIADLLIRVLSQLRNVLPGRP